MQNQHPAHKFASLRSSSDPTPLGQIERSQFMFQQRAASDTLNSAIEPLGAQKVTHAPMHIGDGQSNAAIAQVSVQLGKHSCPGQIHRRRRGKIADHVPDALHIHHINLRKIRSIT